MTKTEKLRMKALHHSQAADHWECKKIEADEPDERSLYERLESRERLEANLVLSVLMKEMEE